MLISCRVGFRAVVRHPTSPGLPCYPAFIASREGARLVSDQPAESLPERAVSGARASRGATESILRRGNVWPAVSTCRTPPPDCTQRYSLAGDRRGVKVWSV